MERSRVANLGKWALKGATSAFKGKTHTEAARKKIGEAQRGNTYRRGVVLSEATKQRMSVSKKGLKMDGDNVNWKGDDASYRAKHSWVEVRLGKPRRCDECGNSKLQHRQYHWANVSGNYQRVITDWRRLCAKCHKAFDVGRAKSVNV